MSEAQNEVAEEVQTAPQPETANSPGPQAVEAAAPEGDAEGTANPPAPAVNYSEFGYRASETIQLPSLMFFKLVTLLRVIEQKESEPKYQVLDTVEATFSENNRPITLSSRLGMEAMALANEMNNLHIANVDAGIATPIAVLQAEAEAAQEAQVTLDEAPSDADGDKAVAAAEESAGAANETDLEATDPVGDMEAKAETVSTDGNAPATESNAEPDPDPAAKEAAPELSGTKINEDNIPPGA